MYIYIYNMTMVCCQVFFLASSLVDEPFFAELPPSLWPFQEGRHGGVEGFRRPTFQRRTAPWIQGYPFASHHPVASLPWIQGYPTTVGYCWFPFLGQHPFDIRWQEPLSGSCKRTGLQTSFSWPWETASWTYAGLGGQSWRCFFSWVPILGSWSCGFSHVFNSIILAATCGWDMFVSAVDRQLCPHPQVPWQCSSSSVVNLLKQCYDYISRPNNRPGKNADWR